MIRLLCDMSLKAFHIVFVIVSMLLTIVVGAWALVQYRDGVGLGMLWFAIGSFVGTVALAVYGRYFLKKLKHIGYF